MCIVFTYTVRYIILDIIYSLQNLNNIQFFLTTNSAMGLLLPLILTLLYMYIIRKFENG
jgi:hypothetical protein